MGIGEGKIWYVAYATSCVWNLHRCIYRLLFLSPVLSFNVNVFAQLLADSLRSAKAAV